MSSIKINIEKVSERINAAAQRAGRATDEITLVAVSKTHPLDTVIEAYQAGLRHFGENRVQEGRDKVITMTDRLVKSPDLEPPTWHMIGHLQSRQVGDALGNFGLLHSIDSLKLARRVNRLAERDNIPPVDILLECNVSGEAAKFGFTLDKWSSDKTQFAAFIKTVEDIAALERVNIRGLMTMAPLSQNPEETRPVFRHLAALRNILQKEIPQLEWQHLSMGMTDDFEVAIEEGATIIRVGRALFGPRQQRNPGVV
jgi:pyridoxal phosphate enzyme (YggS family)